MNLRSAVGKLSLLTALVGMAVPAHAYVYSSEGQYASWSNGSGFSINNNVWGNSSPSQWMYVTSINSFQFYSSQTGTTVKSAPNIDANLSNTPLASITELDAYFVITPPSAASGLNYDFYDMVTTQNDQDEIMLYENWTTANQGPIDSGWCLLINANASFGGSTWHVTVTNPAYQAAGHQCFFIFRNGQRTSGYVDMRDAMNWLKNNHGLYNTNVRDFGMAVEIWNTVGWKYFTWNTYTATFKTASTTIHI